MPAEYIHDFVITVRASSSKPDYLDDFHLTELVEYKLKQIFGEFFRDVSCRATWEQSEKVWRDEQ